MSDNINALVENALVLRLRSSANYLERNEALAGLDIRNIRDAAAEIERLRAALRAARSFLRDGFITDGIAVIDAALSGKGES